MIDGCYISLESLIRQINANLVGFIDLTCALIPRHGTEDAGKLMFIGSLGGWHEVPSAASYWVSKLRFKLYCSLGCGPVWVIHPVMVPWIDEMSLSMGCRLSAGGGRDIWTPDYHFQARIPLHESGGLQARRD